MKSKLTAHNINLGLVNMGSKRFAIRWDNSNLDFKSSNTKLYSLKQNTTNLPEQSLQRKIDYYITPYNRGIFLKKHMDFETESERKKKRHRSEEWRMMSDFILNENRSAFRTSCVIINNNLYRELNGNFTR